MQDQRLRVFAPFRLDMYNERLWRGQEVIRLTPKVFAVLRYLVEHAGKLVTKDELLEAIWSATTVTEAALAVCIGEIRHALGDRPKAPQFIETVYGRGYRFIGKIQEVGVCRPALAHNHDLTPLAPQLVGRETDIAALYHRFERALRGERQVVFITGEAGIGKTTLVEVFLDHLQTVQAVWIGKGQCIDQYGAGEAYLPVLEAFGRLCRQPEGQRFRSLLQQHAPSWLLQMPALLSTEAFETLQRRCLGPTPERMLREFADAIDVLTAERPLILVLEDLHWSDGATLALLTSVARRPERARLLLIGTYRPTDALVRDHPLLTVTQELQQHAQCQEWPLTYLSEAAVTAYLSGRFPRRVFSPALAQALYRRTHGNPLFMVALVETIIRQNVLYEGSEGWALRGEVEHAVGDIPDGLRQYIEQQLHHLKPEDQDMLEAASVSGMTFSPAAVAAALHRDAIEVEVQCAYLARCRQFLQACGLAIWPDGTVTTSFCFTHALYRDVLYHRIPVGQRMRLHRRIGIRKETAYGTQAQDIAAELAVHFVCGRDRQRAMTYLQYTNENALRRGAHQEAITHLYQGLLALQTLPATPDNIKLKLACQVPLGASLFATKGAGASEVHRAYTQALALCQQMPDAPQHFPVLFGLWRSCLHRVDIQTAQDLGEQLLHLAQQTPTPTWLMGAHRAVGTTAYFLGEFAVARRHLECALPHYDGRQHQEPALHDGNDSGVCCLCYMAHTLWVLGYPEQALHKCHEAFVLAQHLAYPYTLAFVHGWSALVYQLFRDSQNVRMHAAALSHLSTPQESPLWSAKAQIYQGWTLVIEGQVTEGLQQIRQGLTAYGGTENKVSWSYLLSLLAATYRDLGSGQAGLVILEEALAAAEKTGVPYWTAELHRLQGECLLLQAPDSKSQWHIVEQRFSHALDIARRQQAKSFELRTAISLSKLWKRQGKRVEAQTLLASIYAWFTEGFNTADLQEAQALLAELM